MTVYAVWCINSCVKLASHTQPCVTMVSAVGGVWGRKIVAPRQAEFGGFRYLHRSPEEKSNVPDRVGSSFRWTLWVINSFKLSQCMRLYGVLKKAGGWGVGGEGVVHNFHSQLELSQQFGTARI